MTWYVSTTGLDYFNGTETFPWDLNTMLANPYNIIYPGDTVLLKSGTYTGTYTSILNGTSENPIIIKPYNDERVIINGKLTVNGSFVQFWDIELCYLDWESRELEDGAAGPDIAPTLLGAGHKLINCIIHDVRAVGFWSSVIGGEINGCVIFYSGWTSPSRGHGHLIYSQNETGTKKIKDCILFDPFDFGIQIYSHNAPLNNYILEGNTMFRAVLEGSSPSGYNIIVGSEDYVANNFVLKSNMEYGTGSLSLDYGHGCDDVVLEDNYFPGGINKSLAIIISETGNYYDVATGNQIFVRPNDYKDTRANVTIYNELESDSIELDLSTVTGLSVSDDVTVINVQDYFVDRVTATLDADKKITIDMRAVSHTVAEPIGWTAPATTFPTFGAFVIEKA